MKEISFESATNILGYYSRKILRNVENNTNYERVVNGQWMRLFCRVHIRSHLQNEICPNLSITGGDVKTSFFSIREVVPSRYEENILRQTIWNFGKFWQILTMAEINFQNSAEFRKNRNSKHSIPSASLWIKFRSNNVHFCVCLFKIQTISLSSKGDKFVDQLDFVVNVICKWSNSEQAVTVSCLYVQNL